MLPTLTNTTCSFHQNRIKLKSATLPREPKPTAQLVYGIRFPNVMFPRFSTGGVKPIPSNANEINPVNAIIYIYMSYYVYIVKNNYIILYI